jgi:hypothetical protein
VAFFRAGHSRPVPAGQESLFSPTSAALSIHGDPS